ncbi:4029_t:CDS:2, partial [Entrophospora sp. SA101]
VIGNDEETKTVLVKNNNNTYACLLAKHTDFSRSEFSLSTKPLPKPKWDEMCFQWCKQQDRKRKENKAPDCKMICFKRLLDQNKKAKDENNNNSWKIKLRKIDDIDGNNGDIAKTLYDKNTTSLNGGNNNNNDSAESGPVVSMNSVPVLPIVNTAGANVWNSRSSVYNAHTVTAIGIVE